MIHRAPFGSMERFIAILLENTAGNFPLWLMPEQVSILSLSEKHEKYAEKVLNVLKNDEIRAIADNRNETICRKIRDAEVNKVPFMLIVGEQEEKDGTVSVRRHGEGDIGVMPIQEFAKMVSTEVASEVKKFNV